MTLINRRVPNIVVPKDENSWTLLYEGQEMNGEYIVLPIPREDINRIFGIQFFDFLNAEFNVLIDEFEEDEISGQERLKKLNGIIRNYKLKVVDPVLKFYFDKLLYMVNKAVEFDTVIMFYF